MLMLALKSLWARRLTAGLTLAAIAISVLLLVGVEKVRHELKDSFARTISGTDLIVGARSGQINLLLYSVFRLGNPTNNISWDSYQRIREQKGVAWTIPLSLGDSHQGFRVLGTSEDYFRYYAYGRQQPLTLAQGRPFNDTFEAVIGADVARKLGYRLGDGLVIAHGAGNTSFSLHEDLPFTLVGILAPTGTPVDRTVHVRLDGLEAIHLGWQSGRQTRALSEAEARAADLTPKAITAFLVGLENKVLAFQLQRAINGYRAEPLSAILPGTALHELWSMMSMAEKAIAFIALFVVVAGLLGMLTTLLAGLSARRRELAILRSLGAGPRHLFALLALEAAILTGLGMLLGLLLLYLGLSLAAPLVQAQYGLLLYPGLPTAAEWRLLGLIWLAGLVIGLLPAAQAYRYSVNDGMSIKQ
ncbi:peptide ABC transporter permease [Zobellella denitrificans]|uniref:Peptide ABC transporter permease n=1 Tax=Zobellella denitrificans TaxID=347534 RepID=A0A291HPS1_9GAMM|nr:ABC transporter permease [Zobellella denitrificans]ATG74109.1 peptide ABC transporter permease [Zobellella denitrificans]